MSNLFRCSAAVSCRGRVMAAADFGRGIEQRNQEATTGRIPLNPSLNFVPKPKTSEVRAPATSTTADVPASDVAAVAAPASASAASFYQLARPNHPSPCLLPPGCDVISISAARWTTKSIYNVAAAAAAGAPNEHKSDSNLCSEGLPVSNLLPPKAYGDDEQQGKRSFQVSSGPLHVDGLSRPAEITFDCEATTMMTKQPEQQQQQQQPGKQEAEAEVVDVVHYGAYRVSGSGLQKHWPSPTSALTNAAVVASSGGGAAAADPRFGAFGPKTLFGTNNNNIGPVLVHACPCPLSYSNFAQLAVAKTAQSARLPLDEQRKRMAALLASSPSLPVSDFVRKVASATVVLCRVPKSKGTEKDQEQSDDNDDDDDLLQYSYYVALTQRAPHMRTFPSFFVVPGGGFDAVDGVVENAARRELLEEVSLQLIGKDETAALATQENSSKASSVATIEDGKWSFLGVWESCFPTHPDADDIVSGDSTVRGHVVFFFSVMLEVEAEEHLPKLKPQKEECSSALWFRFGPAVANRAAKTDFGPVPALSPYFVAESLNPDRIGLTLEMRAQDAQQYLHGNNSSSCSDTQNKKNENNKASSSHSFTETPHATSEGKRMKITAGTEYFIQRALEIQIALGEQH